MANNKKLVVTFAGTAMRFLTPMRVLWHIDYELQSKFKNANIPYKGLASYIDVLGGVSSGSLVAAYLAVSDLKPSNSKDNIQNQINTLLDCHNRFFIPKIFGGIFSSKFDTAKVHENFDEYFGDLKFKDLKEELKFLCTSMDMYDSETTFWTNIGNESSRTLLPGFVFDIDERKIVDAVKASTAAQIFLDAYPVKYQEKEYGLMKHYEIDGANSCTDPVLQTMIVLNALDEVKFEDMFVLSLQSGEMGRVDMTNLANAGALQYLIHIPQFINSLVHCRQENDTLLGSLLIKANGGKYYSVNPKFDTISGVAGFKDSLEFLQQHIKTADKYVNDNREDFMCMVDDLFHFICEKESLQHTHLTLENVTTNNLPTDM